MAHHRRRALPFGLGFCLSGLTAGLALGQISLGPEHQLNTWTTHAQGDPRVAADPAGEFVVAWQSYDQGMGGCYGYAGTLCNGVFARRLDAAGRPLGGEIQVHDSTGVTQNNPAVAKNAASGFVVVWDTDLFYFAPGDIYGRRFDAQGQPLGASFPISGSRSGDQFHAAIDTDADGGFAVVWGYTEVPPSGILARRYDGDGVPLGSDFVVQGMTFSDIGYPAVAKASNGEFVVVWSKEQAPGAVHVVGQRYDTEGQPAGGSIVVDDSGAAGSPAVARIPAGGFVAVWDRSDGAQDVFGRRFDAAGLPLGPAFQVNAYATGAQVGPAVAVDAAGDFLVVWTSAAQDGSEGGVFARRFDGAGAPAGGEFRVNQFTPGDQRQPSVAATPGGGFLVVWQSAGQDGSSWGVFGRRVWTAVFADGFDTGDACAWSAVVGGSCP